MSRHYELMQQAELYFSESAAPAAEPAARPVREKTAIAETQSLDSDCLNLVQRIFLLEQENPPRVVVFAGLHEGDGAKRLCAAAGQHLAHVVRRPVCIVEATSGSGSTQRDDPFDPYSGPSDALMRERPIIDFCTPTQDDNLWVLGPGAKGIPGLLTPENLKVRISELRDVFDFVVIDAPALDQHAEGVIFARLADGAVLVLESGSTRRKESEQIVASLRSSNIRILAAVLNNFAQPIPKGLRSFI
jgi:MinD-like ATPase involved in chromosome partitioning or flagellar assembly